MVHAFAIRALARPWPSRLTDRLTGLPLNFGPGCINYRVQVLCYSLIAAAAYLCGSIPFGYLAAKAKGIDIRSVGSGNIGATNALRVLGKPAGIFVLLMDVFKGYAACAWLVPVIWHGLVASASVSEQAQAAVLGGVCAVLGHNYTCWLKFKGGKGIATTAGVYLALAPWPLLIALLVFLLALALTRYVSVASMTAAVALPAAVCGFYPRHFLLGMVTIALGALAIYKHHANIQRLLAGTEHRLGQKKETP